MTFSIERTAVIVAFDDDTGEALHVDLVYHELEGGYKSVEPSKEACDEIRQLAAEKHTGRKVGVVALRGDAMPEMDGRPRHVFLNDGRTELMLR